MTHSNTQSASTASLSSYRAAMGHALPEDPDLVVALRRYYSGDQLRQWCIPPDLRDVLYPITGAGLGTGFSLNLCAHVVDTLVSSLEMTGWDCDDEATKQWLWERSEQAQFDRECDRLFMAAAVEGESYLIVDYGPDGEPTARVNRRFDGEQGIKIVDVDQHGEVQSAEKIFTQTVYEDAARPGVLVRLIDHILAQAGVARDRDAITRVTRKWRIVYEPERIRWFVNDGRGEHLDHEVFWPYGMPVVRFTSPTAGELRSTVISQQDLINDQALTLAHAARVDSLRIIVSKDLAVLPTGADDEGTSVAIEPGTVIQMTSTGGKQGSIEVLQGSDLASMREILRMHIEHLLLITSTPMSLLPWNQSAAPASGRALAIANKDFDTKCERYKRQFSPRFAQVAELWQRMAGRPVVKATPTWSAPDYHDPQEDLATVNAMTTAGVDQETIWTRLNMTPEEMDRSRGTAAAVSAERTERLAAMLTGADDVSEEGRFGG